MALTTQNWVDNFDSLHKELQNIGTKVDVLGCQALAEGDGAYFDTLKKVESKLRDVRIELALIIKYAKSA